ncbi:MAG: 23S rRNA (adenine(2503)-C(2))-methyltransferase RlmN [Oscillospiraceae bacterium]|nr:23S rRNA (adenine(2503)-C(2))-methyltransferase RlmN [Oscillospiraceae bacterium]
MDNKIDIKSMSLSEVEEYFVSIGEKSFRSKQVFSWLHRGVRSFSEMTDISEKLRKALDENCYINAPVLLKKQVSQIDGTTKMLWQMIDGSAVESVLMKYEHGNTVCISTQVGCAMGCAFCASAIGGLVRNLTSGEILDQVLFTQLELGQKISNIVIMGIGEPLDNFDNLLRFLELVNHPLGMNIGARRISISTCGIVENIDKLADNKIQSTLTVSLHAPDDVTRTKLMPVNRTIGVDRLFEACGNFFRKTGRRVSYEYALIDEVNDTPYHAQLLSERLRNTGSHLNLIPLSEVPERPLRGSPPETIKSFAKMIQNNGINCTVRRSLGKDITASCGQLRGKHLSQLK